MRRLVAVVLSLLLTGSLAAAEVAIRVAGEEVAVSATAAPLADVLDDLARKTGMEVVYEGSPPRHRVTLALEGRSPTEAVLGILEGQGLNYALVADVTGTRVQKLIVAGPAGQGTISGSGSPAPPTRGRRPIMAPPTADPEMLEPDFGEGEDPFDDPALMDEEFPEDDPALEEDPPVFPPEGPPGPAVPDATPAPMPFPGGRQVFPASPFTPQPTAPLPGPPVDPPVGEPPPNP
jgi:hypothetical protein